LVSLLEKDKVYISILSGSEFSDFRNILIPAREWLTGNDIYLPYKLNLDTLSVPYPFTTYLFAVPFTWLQDRFAAGIFFALGSGVLAWVILSNGNYWYFFLFFSWPYVNNLFFSQFAPFITALYFTPSLLIFFLIKPHIALPYLILHKPNKVVFILGIFLVSLILYPTWPWEWLTNLNAQNYIGFPPLFTIPLGLLLFLSLIRYRDKRAWFLLFLAAMPQRMVYDQLGVLLVAENQKQMLFLVLCSWISFPVVLYYNGWENVPWGWQNWVLIASYLPALVVVLMPNLSSMFHKMIDYPSDYSTKQD
jgi:hypothetical protein